MLEKPWSAALFGVPGEVYNIARFAFGPHLGRTVAGIHRLSQAFEVVIEQVRVPIESDLRRRVAQHPLYYLHAAREIGTDACGLGDHAPTTTEGQKPLPTQARHRWHQVMGWATKNEWLGLLDGASLELEALYGRFDGNVLTDESRECVFVAVRRS